MVDEATVRAADWRVHSAQGTVMTQGLSLSRPWEGGTCRPTLRNDGAAPVALGEIVLFSGLLALPPETRLYGEGYQMLSQTAGTLGAPADVGGYTDRGHYRMPEAPGMATVYGLAVLSTPAAPPDSHVASPTPVRHLLLAFTSCRRFVGSIRFGAGRFEVALDAEGLTLQPGAAWDLEEFWCAAGEDRDALLAELAERIARHHPRLAVAEQPTGWCSWYWYGPRVGEADIQENLRAIAQDGLPLRYVQIDDGYQAAMGDWLTTGDRFPGGMRALCEAIRGAGFEPAMWVAPFIAERASRLVQEHPEWLVTDRAGVPLPSDAVSFGGWRNGPWYMLDGTHPGAQAYLEHVFRTMREGWGCRYFKLDALTWGALHGGHRHDRSATRIEAYRRGTAAVHRGAGSDSFVLGCNAPMWGSLGLVHGMRVGGDISRTWPRVARCAQECFWRGWQHDRLWINDPDCVVLANRTDRTVGTEKAGAAGLTDDEFQFHATAVLATGGMVLSGDRLAAIPPERRSQLQRLATASVPAARFDDTTWRSGVSALAAGELRFLFSWSDAPEARELELPAARRVVDYWTEADLGVHQGRLSVGELRPHSARALRLLPGSHSET